MILINNNYTLLHLHSDYSLLDSTTQYEKYVDWAVENGMTAIASTEHGNIYNWTTKKLYCDKKGIKYIHGCEIYLTAQLYHKRQKFIENKDGTWKIEDVKQKVRDNYHTILLAKNEDGIKELNTLISNSSDEDHMYFKPRISFDEFLNISDNIISTSACLQSPLWAIKNQIEQYNLEIKTIEEEQKSLYDTLEKLKTELNPDTTTVRKKKRKPEVIQKDIDKINAHIQCLNYNKEQISFDLYDIATPDMIDDNNEKTIFDDLLNHYTYLEVQPHVNSEDQKKFNKQLLQWAKQYNKPIVCGTDTHSLNSYLADCRTILQVAKGIEFLEEDTFDLTVKTYSELYQMFKDQGVLSNEEIKTALNNTNILADSVEDFELDMSFKYPVFDTPENDAVLFEQKCWEGLEEKIKIGAIDQSKRQIYMDRIREELRVLKKVGMSGFMLSMHMFLGKMRADELPLGFSRGSCGGSLTAFVTDITDCDPIVWGLSFERFCNENRVSLGD